MPARIACLSLMVLLVGGAAAIVRAQDDEPTAKQIAAIRDCVEKNQDDVTEAERLCLFNLVATPCQSTSEGQSNLGMADCFRLEGRIWDDLLNDNFKHLRASLDDQQMAKAREMQRVWIASRERTCGFYEVKIRGSMAIPLGAACIARETARRALLLKSLDGL
ncbi:MAG: lysozyme inhibitor LprI family protein [Xanthobacteraceae bacterium]